MATKRVQVFSTLDEFIVMIRRIVDALDLVAVLYRRGRNSAIMRTPGRITAEQIQSFGASEIFLADSELKISNINMDNLNPAVLGIVEVIVPREHGNVLFMSEVTVQTDWTDNETGKRYKNRQLLSLFNRIKSMLMEDTMTPVLGKNIATGGSAVYSTIRYTHGSQKFFENGGELMQEGVENVRFVPLVE